MISFQANKKQLNATKLTLIQPQLCEYYDDQLRFSIADKIPSTLSTCSIL